MTMALQENTRRRVNISVAPAVHERFAALVGQEGKTVSGVLCDLMTLYCADGDVQDRTSVVADRLRKRLLSQELQCFQRIVDAICVSAGFVAANCNIHAKGAPYPMARAGSWKWTGSIGKVNAAVLLAYDLSDEPDLTVGKALLDRGTSMVRRMILVVPYRVGIPELILKILVEARLELVGVDSLAAALASRPRKEALPLRI